MSDDEEMRVAFVAVAVVMSRPGVSYEDAAQAARAALREHEPPVDDAAMERVVATAIAYLEGTA